MQTLILLSRSSASLKRSLMIDALVMAAYSVCAFAVVSFGAVHALAVLS